MQIKSLKRFSVLAKAPHRFYLHNCRRNIKRPHVLFEKKALFFFRFSIVSLAPECTFLWFFLVFLKIMKINRFYKFFCVSGDFVSQNRFATTTPAHVHLEQGFPLFLRFWVLRNAFLSIVFFNKLSKKPQFLLSQIDYWTPPFWRPVFNDFHENPKMRLWGAPTILILAAPM